MKAMSCSKLQTLARESATRSRAAQPSVCESRGDFLASGHDCGALGRDSTIGDEF